MKKPVLTIRSLVPSHRWRNIRRGRKIQSAVDVDDPFTNVTLQAINDLFTFINHVRSLMSCPFSKKVGLHECFDTVEFVLSEIVKSIHAGKEVGSWSYEENEEIEDLENVLDNLWSPTWNKAQVLNNIDDTDGLDFFISLIEYWINEIRDRGYTIHGLLTGTECFDTVRISLEHLKSVNYPPIYGEDNRVFKM